MRNFWILKFKLIVHQQASSIDHMQNFHINVGSQAFFRQKDLYEHQVTTKYVKERVIVRTKRECGDAFKE